MYIAIVEDHSAIAEILHAMLTIDGGHSVVSFETAQDAMRVILDQQLNARSPSFDLMIVDLLLPGSIDGAEFIARVREFLPNTTTSFILMTGSGQSYDALARKHLLDIPLLSKSKPLKMENLFALLGKTPVPVPVPVPTPIPVPVPVPAPASHHPSTRQIERGAGVRKR